MVKIRCAKIKNIVCIITSIIITVTFFYMSPIKTQATVYYAAMYSVKTCQHGDDESTVEKNARFVQDILYDLGYYYGSLDGDFGDYTRAAVRNYQIAKGLQVDGVVGFYSWGKLLKDGELSPTFYIRTVGQIYQLCYPDDKQVSYPHFRYMVDNSGVYTTVYL